MSNVSESYGLRDKQTLLYLRMMYECDGEFCRMQQINSLTRMHTNQLQIVQLDRFSIRVLMNKSILQTHRAVLDNNRNAQMKLFRIYEMCRQHTRTWPVRVLFRFYPDHSESPAGWVNDTYSFEQPFAKCN